ncbi:hypothetical protein [Frondihabitans sp. Leaf304]|uniref:hypothetical protein n=1 Tax=Frondihabitans sp. Leaf304 TaxID=1736329 RepID=UPI0006F778D9|nr:hypothetical protein [Frondihabitans sp. Leaf304]KQQ28231.1 hypothetical protein ASF54_05955 [Frondihabitans sp. Leaf304]
MVSQVILVMAEYSVEDSPLWFCLSNDKIGLADAGELGLSAGLRRDLEVWNDVFDAIAGSGFHFPSPEIHDHHRAEAFDLAARVQDELGDETHVWCGAGEGVDLFPNLSDSLVVAADSRGTSVEQYTGGRARSITTASAGGRERTARAIIRWRALTERAGSPFGNAQTRSDGLRAAGALQRDIGALSQVIFFGGAGSPSDYLHHFGLE